MADNAVKKSIDCVVDTIRKPSRLATGDAIAMMIDTIIQENQEVTSDEIIKLLQDSGFHSADGLKDFIKTQIKRSKNKTK